MEAFAEDCLDGDDLCEKKWEEDAREVCFVVWCSRCEVLVEEVMMMMLMMMLTSLLG